MEIGSHQETNYNIDIVYLFWVDLYYCFYFYWIFILYSYFFFSMFSNILDLDNSLKFKFMESLPLSIFFWR